MVNLVSRRRRWAAALVAVTLLQTSAGIGPALALGDGNGNQTPPISNGSGTGTSASGSTTSTVVHSCYLYAGPGGFGEDCLGGGGSLQSIREILGHDPLPGCWDVDLTASELQELKVQDTDLATYDFYWQRCLEGIDPKTLTATGAIKVTSQLLPVPKRPPFHPTRLTRHQQELIDLYAEGVGSYPIVTAVTSPSLKVRVNEPAAFSAVPTTSDPVAVGGVVLQARVTSLRVEPLGTPTPATECPGGGVTVSADDTPQTQPDACWFTFRTSSAGQPQQKFPMRVTVTWTVRYTTDQALPWTQWQVLNAGIRVTSTTPLPVYQVQSLNVD